MKQSETISLGSKLTSTAPAGASSASAYGTAAAAAAATAEAADPSATRSCALSRATRSCLTACGQLAIDLRVMLGVYVCRNVLPCSSVFIPNHNVHWPVRCPHASLIRSVAQRIRCSVCPSTNNYLRRTTEQAMARCRTLDSRGWQR